MNKNIEEIGPGRATRGLWLGASAMLFACSAVLMSGCGKPAPASGSGGSGSAEAESPAPQPPPPRAPDRFVIHVTDGSELGGGTSGVPDLYLASSKNGWDPGERIRAITWSAHASLTAAERDDLALDISDGFSGWIFELPAETVLDPAFEFKFTRGDWASVEVAGDGSDIPNRSFADLDVDALPWTEEEDGAIESRIDLTIEGFADQRGTRWSMGEEGEARESSVVGDLRIHEVRARALGPMPRTVRVWVPAGYDDPANTDRRYPVLYMHDGQNLFDAATAGFGMEWRVDETMTALIESGAIEPWIVVGIDHGGDRRVGEMTLDGVEVRGETGYGGRYLSFLVDELIPWVEGEYRVLGGAEHRALGGSSCGGNITIQAMFDRPGVFSRVLIESPALWIGDGVLVRRVARHTGVLPDRMVVAMGNREYGDAQRDAALVDAAESLRDAIQGLIDAGAVGVGGGGAPFLRYFEIVDAKHNEDAWGKRLPLTLRLLLGPGE